MEISYYSGRTNLHYFVETSTDLVNWGTNGVVMSVPAENDYSAARVGLEAKQRFLRLSVER